MRSNKTLVLVAVMLATVFLRCSAQTDQSLLGTWIISKVVAIGSVAELDQDQVNAFIEKKIEITDSEVAFNATTYEISSATVGRQNQQPSIQSDIAGGYINVLDPKIFSPAVPLLLVAFDRSGGESRPRWFFDELFFVNSKTLLLSRGGVYFLVNKDVELSAQ